MARDSHCWCPDHEPPRAVGTSFSEKWIWSEFLMIAPGANDMPGTHSVVSATQTKQAVLPYRSVR